MAKERGWRRERAVLGSALALFGAAASMPCQAAPVVHDPALQVQAVASGLLQPTSMAFLGGSDFLVLEKASGQVQRVVNGVAQGAVLDLAVNSASERGLLGIALQPNFASTGGVYLFWTQSSTGADSSAVGDTSLLGNRVDRFVWNGSSLTFDRNIITLRAAQPDAGQAPRGNNNGGVVRFGPDGKLYVMVGDVGRRGALQNLPNGPTGGPDDQFGGPQPDNAHMTGVILRLNDDGSAPVDNPFFGVGAALGGEVGANYQKVFSYGVRNSFGMDFDPLSGALWTAENGDDAFDEINRVTPGMNGGWVQIMGPVDRIAEYKQIETTEGAGALQQLRWPPSNIADTPAEALSRLFALPGSSYSDPELSWKYGVAPGGLGFLDGGGLGAEYEGDLFVGAATEALEEGYLYRLGLDPTRLGLSFADPDLADLVADNLAKFDGTESESLRFGEGFGIGADIRTGPDGNLYIVSRSHGTIYRISRAAEEVAEPASAGLLAAGLALLALRRGRRESGRSGAA